MRRIRYDLNRPACDRCTSTGRTCEGFPIDATPDRSRTYGRPVAVAPLSLLAPRAYPDVHKADLRRLQYFQQVTAGQLGGYLQDDMWTQLLLQLALTSDPIRHIAVALGTLHETSTFKTTNAEPIRPYALAIQRLQSHLQTDGWQQLEVTLVACILCIGFEWLRGNAEGALAHLRSGLALIEQWRTSTLHIQRGVDSRNPRGHRIEVKILPLFGRLVIQAATLYNFDTIPWPRMPAESVNIGRFTSIEHARDSFMNLLGGILVDTNRRELLRQYTPAADQEHKHQRELFDSWKLHFDVLAAEKRYSDKDAGLSPSPHLIEAIWASSSIMLAGLRPDPQGARKHSEDSELGFSRTVDLCKTVLKHNSVHFTFDLGVVSPLYYTAVNCGDARTRQRAADLLEMHHTREGFWTSEDALRRARLENHLLRPTGPRQLKVEPLAVKTKTGLPVHICSSHGGGIDYCDVCFVRGKQRHSTVALDETDFLAVKTKTEPPVHICRSHGGEIDYCSTMCAFCVVNEDFRMLLSTGQGQCRLLEEI
ncbi:uncharacterized protein AB675_8310 [Cyphellophora attinorum]|uniref:Zn(2)-C6 fungal-type domain-containing protein n=1 Tax=Cyphellophora attinorum TaxID=1664694 RepID=A0A0N1HG10_9EURO|nr:uncharacterized protein AB675_8310 [Phialophora attinorum]KPI44346.1 hypothetical protein AB675_8310 [Phialophora attinorum]